MVGVVGGDCGRPSPLIDKWGGCSLIITGVKLLRYCKPGVIPYSSAQACNCDSHDHALPSQHISSRLTSVI